MNNKINFLKSLFLPLFLILVFTINITNDHISDIFSGIGQQASVIKSTRVENIYNISPSKKIPGIFNFEYQYAKLPTNKKEANFDLPILPFDEEKARAVLKQEYGLEYVDFGPIRDAWGYPVRENAFMKKEETKKQSFLDSLKTNKALAYDEDTQNPGVYNCRANTSVTGYFKAYFEDVALNTNLGFDDPAYGEGRREEACQVLEDMAELLMLDTTTVKPDILFRANSNIPPGALAGATPYFGYYLTNPDNGSMHKHIISQQDPTPGVGNFDAEILTNFNVSWSVDSSLNQNTYDFYTVMWHEVMHTLGFFSSLPSVITSNIPNRYGKFDLFLYKDVTLVDRFLNTLTSELNIPTGAPPAWFLSNEVVYHGVGNYLGAMPGGIYPVYSPSYWQQGSSLSHFDMGRAPGQVYIMHPSTPTNTQRSIHQHEKEVLCHLGYSVDCGQGFVGQIPSSVNDSYLLSGNYPGGLICVSPLLNDLGEELKINTLNFINSQPGDEIVYYFNGNNCSGGGGPTLTVDSQSFYFNPSSDFSVQREFEYTNINTINNMISYPATIYFLPSCLYMVEVDEYVCNGDFELSTLGSISPSNFNAAFWCNFGWNPQHKVPYWCNYQGTPDLFSINNSLAPETSSNNGSFFALSATTNNNQEALVTELKEPLIQNEYILSFDVSYGQHFQNPVPNEFNIIFGLNTFPLTGVSQSSDSPDLPEQIIFNETISTSDWSDNWLHFEQTFIPNDNYQSLVLWGRSNGNLVVFFDNISIRSINNVEGFENNLSGRLYQDLNQNGSYQSSTEPRLSGIQVGLFQDGSNMPIQTATTQDIPNLGKYEFTNLPDGDYYVGLIGENLYQSVTQPAVSTDPFSNYNHMHTVTLEDGEIIENLDFGVVLVNGTPPVNTNGKVDIKVTKELVDSSLSLFDRYITWRIDVRNIGDSLATNVLVKEVIPPGLVYHTHQTPNPNTYDSNVHMLHVPALIPNQQTHIFITMKVPNSPKVCGNKTNIAVLHDLDQLDSNNTNNEGSATIKLQKCRTTVAPEIQVK